MIPNILAHRYSSIDMQNIWSAKNKVLLERQLWVAVLKTQQSLGIDIPNEAIAAYEKAIPIVDLAAIRDREKITRHDVKARLEEFNALAGYEHIHKGMTSRDLTENVEQLQIVQSLRLIRKRAIAVLDRLVKLSEQYADTVMVGRSHNVPAQATTLGKRFASSLQECLLGVNAIDKILCDYPLRGIKGPMGTAQDMLDLVGGNKEKLGILERTIAEQLGFEQILFSVGQIYPRSLDYAVINTLIQYTSGLSSLAYTIRLMAGHELVTEGFAPGQVGSSAMPHKMNARSCERINGLQIILRGYASMLSELSGSQWNEGDVSCSVVRRVALPDSFFAADGLNETALTILTEFNAFPAVIATETEKYLPFVATTKILMAAVTKGLGREKAHEIIKKHAINAALAHREGKDTSLIALLGSDADLPLSTQEISALLTEYDSFIGAAKSQISAVALQAKQLISTDLAATDYQPAAIL